MISSAKTILKRVDQPNELREFPKGKFKPVDLGGVSFKFSRRYPGCATTRSDAALVWNIFQTGLLSATKIINRSRVCSAALHAALRTG